MALDLIRDEEGDVVGVVALEMETGETMILEAKTTIMATGGAGRIFAASTNAFIRFCKKRDFSLKKSWEPCRRRFSKVP